MTGDEIDAWLLEVPDPSNLIQADDGEHAIATKHQPQQAME